MRVNLKVPYADKDKAKRLGARWDAATKVWYVIDPLDLVPFMQWLDEPPIEPVITLRDYLGGNRNSLSETAAKAFGVPHPLGNGWAKKYGNKTVTFATMNRSPIHRTLQ